MRHRAPVQLPLFGPQSVHIGYRGYCLMCKVLLALADDLTDCSPCPGWVEPAPPWAVLGEYRGVSEPLERAA
jgi:hypothetical protein